jgi:hypothetical protein
VLVYILSLNVVKRVYIQHLSMSNFKLSITMDNFFSRPVGAAVLYLNDLHFGKHLNDLNRCARLVPKDVKGMASMLSNTTYLSDDAKDAVIDTLVEWANDAENAEK